MSFVKRTLCFVALLMMSMHVQAALTIDKVNTSYFFTEQLSLLVDDSDEMRLNDVRHHVFNDTAKKSVALGFLSHPVWLKAQFTVATDRPISDVLLVLNAPVMDEVDVYLLDAHGALLTHYRAGDQLQTESNSLSLRMPVFNMALNEQQSYTLYMRFRTTHNAFYVEPKLSFAADWEQQNMMDFFVLAIAIAVMSIVIVMATISLLMFKQVEHVHMMLFSLLILGTFLLPNGWLNLLLPIGWADIGNVLIQAMMPVPALYIAKAMLHLNVHLPRVFKVQFGLTWLIFVVGIIAVLTDRHTLSLSITQPGVLILIVFMMAESVYLYRKEKVAKHFLLMFVGMLIALTVRYGSIHGFVPINFLTTNLPVFTGLVMALFLYYSLVLSLRQSEDERMLECMKAEQAEREVERRKLFINMMAHELNTPLAVAEAALSNLPRSLSHPEAAEKRIVKVQENLQHMNKVIELCLMNERLSTTEAIAMHAVRVADLMKSVNDHLLLIQDTERLTITVLPDASFTLTMDIGLLSIALVNVIDNALKYSPPSSDVMVTCRCEADEFIIDVQDKGAGFDKQSEPNTLVERKHFGIGLLITKQIIGLHRGEIVFKTASNGGGLVSIILPIADGD